MTIRTFVALEIPDEALNILSDIRNGFFGCDEKYKWETKEKLHLTLKFLGDTDVSLLESIESALKSVTENKTGLSLRINKFGTFNKDGKPRILWAGFDENKELEKLYSEIENAMSALGFSREERRFSPHLTLLRVKGHENIKKISDFTKSDIKGIGFITDTVSLIKSELKRTGSEYTALRKFYLKN